jgi:mannose-1-phosphate guanylyltransferase
MTERPASTAGCLCSQAVVLVGGEGTRLRPITSRVPKPVVPLVGRPFVGYVLENLARHGVARAVFSAGYLAHALEDAIGDGDKYGLSVRYVVEDRPLGTAGAIKHVEAELDGGCLFAFNGDVLTDVDLTAMGDFHRERGAAATILLTAVDDPRRYGLVEVRDDGSVAQFLEKPGSEYALPPRGALINAGVYVLEPEVLDMIPAGQQLSIERGIFPRLADEGRLFGFVGDSYWRDIGTPDSYLEAHFDLLQRTLRTSVSADMGESYLYVSADAVVAPGARVVPPAHIGGGTILAPGSRVGPLAVVGRGCSIADGAEIREAVLQDDVAVGARSLVERSVIVANAVVGDDCHLVHAVVGDGCRIGSGNVVANGCCLYPGTELGEGSIKFREFDGVEGR